jgi:hypothetical protein
MLVLRSDDNSLYLINCVDKGSYLLAGLVYADPQKQRSIVVKSNTGKQFVLVLPDDILKNTTQTTGVNVRFDYG